MMSKEAMKLALEALKFALHVGFDESSESQIKKGDKAVQQHQNAITALREALAEQPAQQEPVAWMDGYRNIYSLEEKAAGCEDAVIPLVPATLQHWSDCAVHNEPAYPAGKCDCGGYTAPPAQRTWVGLTDEEKNQVAWSCGAMSADWLEFAGAIEAKLKEKNT